MPLKIVKPDHIEIMGKGMILLTAPHAAGPDADLHTGPIVEDTALIAKCYAMIGKVSREYLDLNRIASAKSDFRTSIQTLLDENNVHCILDIHGKRDPGVEIGTSGGASASSTIRDIIQEVLSKQFKSTLNGQYKGMQSGNIISTFSKKNSDGGFDVEAVQVEFGHEERTVQRDQIVTILAEIVMRLNLLFSGLVANESTGGNLDEAYPGLGKQTDSKDESSGNP